MGNQYVLLLSIKLIIGILVTVVYYSNSSFAQESLQYNFITGLEKYCSEYDQQQNEIMKSDVYNQILQAEEKLLNQSNWNISGWQGNISVISTDKGGQWVDLEIASEINGYAMGFVSLRFFGSGGIQKGSKVYGQLSTLKVGSPILFSGEFERGEHTGIETIAVTERGSVCNPSFKFNFSDIVFDPKGTERTIPVGVFDHFFEGLTEPFKLLWNYWWIALILLFTIAILQQIQKDKKKARNSNNK